MKWRQVIKGASVRSGDITQWFRALTALTGLEPSSKHPHYGYNFYN